MGAQFIALFQGGNFYYGKITVIFPGGGVKKLLGEGKLLSDSYKAKMFCGWEGRTKTRGRRY